jgi:UMF1 family MFS transporter
LPGTQDWSFLPEQPLFGFDQSTHEHDRIVGPLTGVWILLFSLPVLLFTPDGSASSLPLTQVVKSGLKDVIETVRQLKHYANIARYLLARMFYNDGMVGVLVFGGIYASGTFQWGSIVLLIFGLCTSLSAMVGAYVGGMLDDKLGSMKTLKIAVGMSSLILLLLVSYQPDTIFFVLPVSTEPVWNFPYFNTVAEIAYFCTNQIFALFFVTGLSVSRTLMARISPPSMAAQFFGLYGLSGSVTAFLAPLLVATTTSYFQSQRLGFASLVLLMALGGTMLLWVNETQASVAPKS